MTFSYFGKVLAKTRFLRDLYRDQCLCRYDHAHCCSMHNAISTFLKSIVTYRNSASLLEKNLRKLKIQWIFVDGVEWKSNIFDFSIKNDFQSTPSTNTVIIEFSFFADFFHLYISCQYKLKSDQCSIDSGCSCAPYSCNWNFY